jgi:hypothetical protein
MDFDFRLMMYVLYAYYVCAARLRRIQNIILDARFMIMPIFRMCCIFLAGKIEYCFISFTELLKMCDKYTEKEVLNGEILLLEVKREWREWVIACTRR